MLRPQFATEGEGGQPSSGYPPMFGVRETEAHDPDVLPRMHGLRELASLFPLPEAPPPGDNVEDWEPFHVGGVEDDFRVHRELPWPYEGVAA